MRSVKHKFRAKPQLRDGMHFSSKLEARYYDTLKLRVAGNDVVFFLRQVPFHLPGGVKYVVDFVEFRRDGTVVFVDTKGPETALFTAKKKLVESLYPVEIEVVKKA